MKGRAREQWLPSGWNKERDTENRDPALQLELENRPYGYEKGQLALQVHSYGFELFSWGWLSLPVTLAKEHTWLSSGATQHWASKGGWCIGYTVHSTCLISWISYLDKVVTIGSHETSPSGVLWVCPLRLRLISVYCLNHPTALRLRNVGFQRSVAEGTPFHATWDSVPACQTTLLGLFDPA